MENEPRKKKLEKPQEKKVGGWMEPTKGPWVTG